MSLTILLQCVSQLVYCCRVYSSIKSRFTAGNRRHEDHWPTQLPVTRRSRAVQYSLRVVESVLFGRNTSSVQTNILSKGDEICRRRTGRRPALYCRMDVCLCMVAESAINMAGDSWPRHNESASASIPADICLPTHCSAG